MIICKIMSVIDNLKKPIDNKKRNFLKTIGIAGISALVVSLIPKKASALVFGSSPAASHVGIKDSANTPIDPMVKSQLPTELTTSGNLKASILGGAANGVAGANVGLKNSSEQHINQVTNETVAALSQNESIVLLRRIVKQLESSATVDKSNRQRIVLDGVSDGATGITAELNAILPVFAPSTGSMGYQSGVGYGQPIQAQVATQVSTPVLVTDGVQFTDEETGLVTPLVWTQAYDPITGEMIPPVISTVMSPGGDVPYSTNTLASSWYSQITEGLVDQRWRVAEESHIAYQRGIRSQIIIS